MFASQFVRYPWGHDYPNEAATRWTTIFDSMPSIASTWNLVGSDIGCSVNYYHGTESDEDYLNLSNVVGTDEDFWTPASKRQFTMCAHFKYNGGGTDEHTILGSWQGNTATNGFLFRVEPADDTFEVYVRGASANFSHFTTTALTVPVGEWCWVFWSYDVDNDVSSIIINGARQDENGLLEPQSTCSGEVHVGASPHTSSDNLNGNTDFWCFWDRALDPVEIKIFQENPWQIFEPRRIFVPSPAAGGPNTYSDSISEAVDFTESIASTLTAVASHSEPVDLTESFTTALTAVGSVSETVELAEAMTVVLTAIASHSEQVDFEDTFASAIGGLTGEISESVEFTESLTAVLNAAASVSEPITFEQTASVVATLTASQSEPVELGETLTALLTAGVSWSDAVEFTETLSATAGDIAAAVQIMAEKRDRIIRAARRNRIIRPTKLH